MAQLSFSSSSRRRSHGASPAGSRNPASLGIRQDNDDNKSGGGEFPGHSAAIGGTTALVSPALEDVQKTILDEILRVRRKAEPGAKGLSRDQDDESEEEDDNDKKEKVVLVIDGLDFLLAASSEGNEREGSFVMDMLGMIETFREVYPSISQISYSSKSAFHPCFHV